MWVESKTVRNKCVYQFKQKPKKLKIYLCTKFTGPRHKVKDTKELFPNVSEKMANQLQRYSIYIKN